MFRIVGEEVKLVMLMIMSIMTSWELESSYSCRASSFAKLWQDNLQFIVSSKAKETYQQCVSFPWRPWDANASERQPHKQPSAAQTHRKPPTNNLKAMSAKALQPKSGCRKQELKSVAEDVESLVHCGQHLNAENSKQQDKTIAPVVDATTLSTRLATTSENPADAAMLRSCVTQQCPWEMLSSNVTWHQCCLVTYLWCLAVPLFAKPLGTVCERLAGSSTDVLCKRRKTYSAMSLGWRVFVLTDANNEAFCTEKVSHQKDLAHRNS